MAIVVLTLPSFRQSESRGIDACDTTAALSHSQSRPRSSLARFVGLSGILLLLSESRSKEVFISGGAIDPRLARSADAFRAKREAAKLCTTNGIKQRERGKRKGGREAGVPAAPRNRYFPLSFFLMLLPFPFLTVGRSIGSRKRCTRNWPRPQTATYRASYSPPPPLAHANSRFFPSKRAGERGKNNHTNRAVTANKRSECERASSVGNRLLSSARRETRKAAIRWRMDIGGEFFLRRRRRQSGLGG